MVFFRKSTCVIGLHADLAAFVTPFLFEIIDKFWFFGCGNLVVIFLREQSELVMSMKTGGSMCCQR